MRYHPVEGGGVLTGRLQPEVQPLTLLYTILGSEGTPIRRSPFLIPTYSTYINQEEYSSYTTESRRQEVNNKEDFVTC